MVINVTAQTETHANDYVYDASGSGVVNSTIVIDGTRLPVMSDSTIHWANLKTTWADGSSHTHSVTTADGKTVSGTMVKSVGTYLKAVVQTSTGGYYSIDNYPVGSDVKTVPILFTGKN